VQWGWDHYLRGLANIQVIAMKSINEIRPTLVVVGWLNRRSVVSFVLAPPASRSVVQYGSAGLILLLLIDAPRISRYIRIALLERQELLKVM